MAPLSAAPANSFAAPNTSIGPITLRYFDLPGGLSGRGGAVRLFLKALDLPFDNQLVTFAEWKTEKAKLVDSKENVSGHLPIVYISSKKLTEHHAIMRYVSRSLGLYGKDAELDYEIDKLADASVEWRNSLVDALFGDDAAKTKYKEQQCTDFYGRFEHFLSANGSALGYAVSSDSTAITFADALLYALMWDDQGGFGAVEGFGHAYPRLAALWARFGTLPAVKAWCDGVRPPAQAA